MDNTTTEASPLECCSCKARPMGSNYCNTLYCQVRGQYHLKYRSIMKDPWEHRTEGMRCPTCMWAVFGTLTSTVGRCRRHSPTMSGYPAIYRDDWCGDHKMEKK